MRIAITQIPYAQLRLKMRLSLDNRSQNIMRKIRVGIANQNAEITSCRVISPPNSEYVKRNASVVMIGAAASMPPYLGSA